MQFIIENMIIHPSINLMLIDPETVTKEQQDQFLEDLCRMVERKVHPCRYEFVDVIRGKTFTARMRNVRRTYELASEYLESERPVLLILDCGESDVPLEQLNALDDIASEYNATVICVQRATEPDYVVESEDPECFNLITVTKGQVERLHVAVHYEEGEVGVDF